MLHDGFGFPPRKSPRAHAVRKIGCQPRIRRIERLLGSSTMIRRLLPPGMVSPRIDDRANERSSRLHAYSAARGIMGPRNARPTTTRPMIACIVVARRIRGADPGEGFVGAPSGWQVQPDAPLGLTPALEATIGVVSSAAPCTAPMEGAPKTNIMPLPRAGRLSQRPSDSRGGCAKQEPNSATMPLERLIRTRAR